MRLAAEILAMAVMMSGASVWAQTATSAEKVSSDPIQTFYLNNFGQTADSNDIVTTLRNTIDPQGKIYYVASQNAIVVRAPADQMALAQKLLKELDRPKKAYRLTYTLTQIDEGKRVGTQHFAMIVVAGQRTTLKQGNKVPVLTGSYTKDSNSGTQTQFTYLDIGMNFDASLDEFANGVRLRSKVEQLGIAEEKSSVGLQDPIIRQTAVEGTSILTVGKPLILGSFDIPGSTRHVDVEVVMETVP